MLKDISWDSLTQNIVNDIIFLMLTKCDEEGAEMSRQLKVRDNSDNTQIEHYKETVCVVRTPEGRAAERRRGKKEDLPGYIIFSILSIICSVGAVYLLEMALSLKYILLIPAALGLVFAIVAKSKRSGVMSVMALVFGIIALTVVASVVVACVCVNQFVDEAKTEYVQPITEDITDKVSEWLPWLND